MNVFIDESGHSGANLHDPDQPIYACAAVWVRQDSELDFEAAVNALLRSRRVQAPELKGGSLATSNRGRETLIALGGLCSEHEVEVSLIVQHKPFMAAAVFIEECTDHMHNPAFDADWTWDTRRKEPAAKLVFDAVAAPALMRWWLARRDDDLSELEAAHRDVIEALGRANADTPFVDALACVDLKQILCPTAECKEHLYSDYSPNVTTFVQLLHSIESHAVDRRVTDVCIIHDEQVEFEDAFRRTFAELRNADYARLTLPNGNSLVLPVKRIGSIEFRDSSRCRCLQVSDCMAALARVALASATDQESSKLPVLRQFLPVLQRLYADRSGNGFPWVVGPLCWQRLAFAVLMGLDPRAGT